MIPIIDLDTEDLEGIATAIAMSNYRPRVTRDPSAIAGGEAGMLPDSISIAIRSDR
jgi:hypothetical protein